MKKPMGLGRGLSALIDDRATPRDDARATGLSVREVEVGRIRPNPSQPRRHFDENSLIELAASIAERGVLQPIIVRPSGDGFELVAGERRWRAAQRAQLHRIPALVRDMDSGASAEIALIENVQRENLSAIEEAQAYQELTSAHGHSQEQVGKLVGKSRSHVANLLRLLDLPADVREMLLRGDISMGHGRAIASAPDPSALAKEIVAGGLSVRQAEIRAKQAKPGAIETKSAKPAPRGVDADLDALQRQLGDMLGLRVKVAHGARGGTVTLNYSSLDQLDLICQRLSGERI